MSGAERELIAPWGLLANEGEWLVLAATVPAVEPLSSFFERVDAAIKAEGNTPGVLRPSTWDAHRRDVREHGVPLEADEVDRLKQWGERFGLPLPASCG
jgi:hypothetical protein